MSLTTRGLYPNLVALNAWTTFSEAVAWSRASPEAWKKVSADLGEEGLDEPLLVAAVPPHKLITSLAKWIADDGPSTMEAVRMGLALNAVRLKFDMELVDLLPPPAGTTPAPAPAPVPTALPQPVVGVKVKLSQVIDQGMDQEVPILGSTPIGIMRRRYIAVHGDPPLQKAEVTDAQLTALDFKVGQGLAPYADFGVWGPHGARMERRMRFTSHVFGPDGTWRTVELPGADCLDTWRDCWAVFKSAAIMINLALPATLDRYEQMFVERCRRYQGSWHLCAQADIRCRGELVIELRRDQERFHAAHPAMSGYDPDMPWNSVLKAAAQNNDFWDRELKEPALLFMMGRGKSHPSHVEQQPDRAPTQQEGTSNPRKRKRRGGGGNGAQHPQQQQQQQPNNGGKASGKGGKGKKGQGQNRNGKHVYDRNGKQICFSWARSDGGCTNGQCPNGRSHVCEICLQPHRTIHHVGEGGAQKGRHM